MSFDQTWLATVLNTTVRIIRGDIGILTIIKFLSLNTRALLFTFFAFIGLFIVFAILWWIVTLICAFVKRFWPIIKKYLITLAIIIAFFILFDLFIWAIGYNQGEFQKIIDRELFQNILYRNQETEKPPFRLFHDLYLFFSKKR